MYKGAFNGMYPSIKSISSSEMFKYPTPPSLNYTWSFGFLSGVGLIIQIITGLTLIIYYTPIGNEAFESVDYVMREVNNGWFVRYTHSNGASFMFITVYGHILRNIYYKTYAAPRHMVWYSGIVLLIMLMAIAFLGYVLPWGQMSFRGATVITSLFKVIPEVGDNTTIIMWGGLTVSTATLKRFYMLHYILPFVMLFFVIFHIYLVHKVGSSNPGGVLSEDKIKFFPYFYTKDLFALWIYMFALITIVCWFPNLMGHVDNYIKANSLTTPEHIVPEWYFLHLYAILRCIPNKIMGVSVMAMSIVSLTFLPKIDKFGSFNDPKLRGLPHQIVAWTFIGNLLILGWLGAQAVAEPFITMAQFHTFLYFFIIHVLFPATSLLEKLPFSTTAFKLLDVITLIKNWCYIILMLLLSIIQYVIFILNRFYIIYMHVYPIILAYLNKFWNENLRTDFIYAMRSIKYYWSFFFIIFLMLIITIIVNFYEINCYI